jgi:hypothetical protein
MIKSLLLKKSPACFAGLYELKERYYYYFATLFNVSRARRAAFAPRAAL